MRDHFRVGLGRELVAHALQLSAQLFVIFDDAVVNDGKTVARDVRMCIPLTRDAVRGPACMRDTELAVSGRLRERLLQHLHLAHGAQAREVLCAVQNREPRRVVAAIFKPTQTLHQDRHDVPLGYRPYDSTHGSWPSCSARKCASRHFNALISFM
jgi:hypothetical protein